MARVFLIVADSFGIGEMPDARFYGDEGSNTLRAVASSKYFNAPTLKKMGLFNIDGVDGEREKSPVCSYARMAEMSKGKDTISGHYEIAGVITNKAYPTYKDGFPKEIIEKIEEISGRKVLCNKPYSGTEVIKDYGNKHLKTGDIIVYTSADSVLQIATHTDVLSENELWLLCEKVRKIMKNEHAVARVIARPFTGEYPFVRTAGRKDYALGVKENTMLDLIKKSGQEVVAVGKINDIFSHKGITRGVFTKSNEDCLSATLKLTKEELDGLVFVNLVDFDMKFGHRNDIDGYAKAINYFDKQLEIIMSKLKNDDLLIVTADHGCDPSTPSTDHSREYVPMLAFGDKIKKGINLATRESFADISATVLEYLGVDKDGTKGESFLKNIM